MEAERRQATVPFADMVGFTAFSEKSGTEAAFTPIVPHKGVDFRPSARAIGVAVVLLALPLPAYAVDQVHDEIQVYNAEIAEVGQFTYEQHFNYAAIGQTAPEFPGGFTSNHSLQGTPEFAYGVAKWWEVGFYLPFAVDGAGEFLSDGAKIRSLFVVPDAAKRSFFYGINFELGYELPPFAPSPWALEIRPIIGVRNSEWELIANPIIDASFGSAGEVDLLRHCGRRATSAMIASSGSSITPTSAKSATSYRCSSKASNCLR